MPPPSGFSMRFHTFGKPSLLPQCLPSLKNCFLPPFKELLFQHSSAALLVRCCCHPLLLTLKWCYLAWVNLSIFLLITVSDTVNSCAALAIYVLPPVWLSRGHNFHFAYRKFQEKLSNTGNSQSIRSSLKRGGLSVVVLWGKNGAGGDERKHQM